MNKIQYIKLLNLRGIYDLDGITLAEAVKQSGGAPNEREMMLVNQQAMEYYIYKYTEQQELNKKLSEENKKLQDRDDWLTCLEAAGVDNWEEYEIAVDIYDKI